VCVRGVPSWRRTAYNLRSSGRLWLRREGGHEFENSDRFPARSKLHLGIWNFGETAGGRGRCVDRGYTVPSLTGNTCRSEALVGTGCGRSGFSVGNRLVRIGAPESSRS
ncbi:MAG: hypothetical protein BJ554DRAFT_2802, partial [Olpidium bornovanus]